MPTSLTISLYVPIYLKMYMCMHTTLQRVEMSSDRCNFIIDSLNSAKEKYRGVFEILRSSAFIYKYYPTNTLGDNLSTSSGTWVVVKSKREVPRGVRNSTFFGIHIQILPDKYPRDNLSTSSGTWVVVKSKREVPRGVRNSTFFGIHIQILPDKYPRGQLVHQQWHMGSG